ncbi:MAG TPA: hypothetical protein PK055_05370 [Gammaproteobacteria bacterium]|nr:hypothetical protein [Xanthomonadales bacterium]MCB1593760.1 hypothetical protein [Xanthomonadales bacterium]HPI95824.1 hypothetical protein [Gammaproteobacteria bacterium]HPQ87066.1 hypothetical protein [Gammaproteobacteria bacterium]
MKRIVFLLIVFSSHIFAQNLLNNPHFDTDTLDIDWPDGNGTGRSWVSDDGALADGCMEVPTTNNNGGTLILAYSENIPVVPGEKYYYEVLTKVLSSSQASGSRIWIKWLDTNQSYVGFQNSIPSNGVFDSWEPILGIFTVPADMYFAKIYVGVSTTSTGSPDPSIARFDDILFEADLIFTNSFEEIVVP